MGRSFPAMPATPGSAQPEDLEVEAVVRHLEAIPEFRERMAWTLRDSLDETLDGGRTGRWCYQHLKKTEKTGLGTAMEINIQKEFDFEDGRVIDWRIAGVEIDCKFSKDYGGWPIPMEMYLCPDHGDRAGTDNHLALLTWMNDDLCQWAVGIVRVTDDRLAFKKADPSARVYNGDNKRTLNVDGLWAVYWLWGGVQNDLPPNVLLHMSPTARRRVFSASNRAGPARAGQQRINQLFREVQGEIVSRRTILTVAQQDDPMRRARNARSAQHLQPEGIMVLGHQEADPYIAQILELPIPVKGEFVACRVVPCSTDENRPRVFLDNAWWRLADADDPVVSAPTYPRQPAPGDWLACLTGAEPWPNT